MKKQVAIWIVACLLIGSNTFSQNQANIWYFGYKHGLDFNSGYPEYLEDCPDWQKFTTSISDTNGNLLFLTNGETIWNKDREIMQNGEGLHGSTHNAQPAVICPDPGNPNKYYVFTIGTDAVHYYGLEYNIVDMSLDNGKGAVVSKNIVVPAGEFARHKITAVRHANNIDWWIITRFHQPNVPDKWASFSLTSSGVNPVPVIRPAAYIENNYMQFGSVKVSHDKRIIVSVQSGNNFGGANGRFDVCGFDNETGVIHHRFYIKEHPQYPNNFGIYGMELSPDSKLLYISFYSFHLTPPSSHLSFIYQYDMTKTDSLDFLNSRLVVDLDNYAQTLQLAPDGKIYVSTIPNDPLNSKYLGVIHDVWKKGPFCNYQKNAIELNVSSSGSTLPSFPSELLYRFVFEGRCAKTPFTFNHRFIPMPDSIVWSFGDGATSTDFNPTHIFQTGGNYEVHAHVVYPDGRIEETSREVEVMDAPEPILPDTLMLCVGETAQLDAGGGYAQYNWNGQLTPGNQYYQVSDSGIYTVRIRNNLNCYAYDTAYVAFHTLPLLDQSNLVIQPTTCNNATGSITGLVVEPGTSIAWKNNNDEVISTEIDISGLAVGNYFLWLTDKNDCTVLMETYTINNLDSDLIIENATAMPALCGKDNGQITVSVQQGLGNMLYSITNGPPYLDNGGLFTNLAAGNYNVRVMDEHGCDAIYANNPVKVAALGGPVITGIASSPATGSGSDGSITISATGDSLFYSLQGAPGQPNGGFTGLTAGDYTITVADKYGCDTTFVVTVDQLTGYALSTIVGTARKCLQQQATSALKVTNLNGVKEFRVGVFFDNTRLTPQGFSNMFNPEMTATIYGDRVILEWQGEKSLTITDTVNLITLIFETIQPGTADVYWDLSADSWFRDENGNDIPVQPIDGFVSISSPPVMVTNGDKRLCEGDLAIITANVLSGGMVPFDWQWSKPDGSTVEESSIWLFGLTQAESGTYTIKLTDAYNCLVEDSLTLTVIPPPTANFPTTNDTIYFEKEYLLQATPGYAGYQWSTGDTTYYINITDEGEYSVTLQTAEGCTNLEKVMMIDTWFPFHIPTAFTPNGDGLNDSFRPVVDYDRVRQFGMIIYDRWGKRIFETTNPSKGWDGADFPAGIYGWVITWTDGSGKMNKLRGSVTMVK